MSDFVLPHRRQPTRLLRPWDSPGKNTGVGCHFLLQCMHACYVASVVSDSMRPYGQQPTRLLSTGFSRQEYWSGLPFPSLGDLPNPGIEPRSPALQADSLPTELWGKCDRGGYKPLKLSSHPSPPSPFLRPLSNHWCVFDTRPSQAQNFSVFLCISACHLK